MAVAMTGLTAAYLNKMKLPDSISAVVYELPKRWQWLWSVWVWLLMVLLAKPLIGALGGEWWRGFIGFLTLASMGIVGAVPLSIDGSAEKSRTRIALHYGMAWVMGLLTQLCVWLICPAWLWLWSILVILAGVMIVLYDKPWVQWIDNALAGKGVLLLEALAAVALIGAIGMREPLMINE